MEKDINNHLNNVMSDVNNIFELVILKIKEMNIDEKIPSTILAKNLSEELKLTPNCVYNTMLFLTKENYPGVIIHKGAHGGILKKADADATEHKEATLKKIKGIFESAIVRIDALKVGERLICTNLAKDLSVDANMSHTSFYHVLSLLIKNYPKTKIKPGAKGGLEKTL